MNREDCWMTFTEALEQYLKARHDLSLTTSKWDRDLYQERMKEAAEHMDALTGEMK